MTWVRFYGPVGKMPPDTAGKDARRYGKAGADERRSIHIRELNFS